MIGLLASAAVAPVQAQQPVPPQPSQPQDNQSPKGEEQRPILRGPDGKPLVLPPGAKITVIGPDGKPVPVPIGPDGRPQLPVRPQGSTAEADGREIVVRGQKPRGSVIGDIPPERVLTPLDIRARGAGTLAELLQSLEPQTRSNRGRGDSGPVVLVNGKRVSSFQEIANIPPEAIERTEIFPEELALQYGYRADQKVVNVVTFERFRSAIGQVGFGFPTDGGRENYSFNGNYLLIQGDRRFNFDLDYQRAGSLLESERDIDLSENNPFDLTGNVAPVSTLAGAEVDPLLSALAGQKVTRAAVPANAAAGAPSLAAFAAGANSLNQTDTRIYRSLLPSTERLSLNATVSDTIFGDVAASLNGRFEVGGSDSRLGLAAARLVLPEANPFSPFSKDVILNRYFDPSRPLRRDTDTRLAHLGTALNGRAGEWLWSFTGNVDRLSTKTLTDAGIDVAALQARLDAGDPKVNPFANDISQHRPRDEARSVSTLASGQLVFSGSLFELPAGQVSTSLRAGFDTQDFSSETRRQGSEQSVDLSRDRGSVQANLALPIASRSEDALSALGSLHANFSAELERLSDFGSLKTLSAGLYWSPVPELNLNASVTDEDGAPTVQQLGNPLLVTPGVPTFDYGRGETVDAIRIDGGNPDLRADNRRLIKLGLSAKPSAKHDLRFSVDYLRSRIEDPIAAFPAATPQIEAAFPDRFTRDGAGRLLSIDSRPLNFERRDQQQVRWGLNFSRALRKVPGGRDVSIRFREGAPPPGQLPPGLPEGAVVIRAEAGSALARQFEGFLSRIFVNAYHTWHIEDEILIRPGIAELDLLNGDALGSRGGQPRHELDFQAGIFHSGLGAQLNAKWRSGTSVEGLGPTGDLRFSDYGTMNLNLFANLQQRTGGPKAPWWAQNTRISLGINNLLDGRPNVRNAVGAVPFSYQPAFLEPLGRSVSLNIRKRFF
ncbi:MAG TPA: TonB-dependent receptor [Allosphingosinicella sp.]